MFGPIAHAALTDIRPPGAADRTGAGTLVAPPARVEGGTFSLAFTLTPRPPVSVKEARRVSTEDAVAGWATVLQVAEYLVPNNGAAPTLRTTRYVLSRLVATAADGVETSVSLRIVNLQMGKSSTMFPDVTVPATGFLDLPLQSATLDAQDVLQMRVLNGGEVHVSASYVNVTREQFDVI